MVSLSWLRKPDVTTVSGEVTRLKGRGNILLNNDGTAGSVDEIRAWDVISIVSLLEPVGRYILPFFILEMSFALNISFVFSCKGQLIVTMSHCSSISSRSSTRSQPISCSFSLLRGW